MFHWNLSDLVGSLEDIIYIIGHSNNDAITRVYSAIKRLLYARKSFLWLINN